MSEENQALENAKVVETLFHLIVLASVPFFGAIFYIIFDSLWGALLATLAFVGAEHYVLRYTAKKLCPNAYVESSDADDAEEEFEEPDENS
jgi:hypothetical protein